MRRGLAAITAFFLLFQSVVGKANPCPDLEAAFAEVAGPRPVPDDVVLRDFRSVYDLLLADVRNEVDVLPNDPRLQTVGGRLAFIEALSTPGQRGLLKVEEILSRANNDSPRLQKARRRLEAIGESLSLQRGIRWVGGLPPRIQIKFRNGVTPRELGKLVEKLYALTIAVAPELAPPNLQPAADRVVGSIFWSPFRKTYNFFAKRSENLVRARVEKILLENSMANALDKLGFMRDPSIRDLWAGFRASRANEINGLITFAVNYPLMQMMGAGIPWYLPQLSFVKGKRVKKGLLEESQGMLADGKSFEEHWQFARQKYIDEFGYRPQIDQAYSWSKEIYSYLLLALVGVFVIQNAAMLSKLIEVMNLTDEDVEKAEQELFDLGSVVVRDELFAKWRKSYISFNGNPPPVCDEWLAGKIFAADKQKQDSKAFIERLKKKFEDDLAISAILISCRKYITKYIEEFSSWYHKRTDDDIRVYKDKTKN